LLLGLPSNQGGTKKNAEDRDGLEVRRIGTPSRIRVRVKLKRAGAGKEQATVDSATKVAKDAKEVTIVDGSGSRHELAEDVNGIRDIRTSDAKVHKAAHKVAIASGILKRNTVSGT